MLDAVGESSRRLYVVKNTLSVANLDLGDTVNDLSDEELLEAYLLRKSQPEEDLISTLKKIEQDLRSLRGKSQSAAALIAQRVKIARVPEMEEPVAWEEFSYDPICGLGRIHTKETQLIPTSGRIFQILVFNRGKPVSGSDLTNPYDIHLPTNKNALKQQVGRMRGRFEEDVYGHFVAVSSIGYRLVTCNSLNSA